MFTVNPTRTVGLLSGGGDPGESDTDPVSIGVLSFGSLGMYHLHIYKEKFHIININIQKDFVFV
jgi:hypothetical protein